MNAVSRSPVRFLAVAAVLASGGAPTNAADAPRSGEYCLRVALPALGFTEDQTAAAVEALGAAPATGHAPADLAAAVAAAGGVTLAVNTTLENLASRSAAGDRFACVARLDGDRYALLSGFQPGAEVRVIDPPDTYTQPPETLASRWDGAALLVARERLTPEDDLAGPFPWTAVLLAAAGVGLLVVGGVWIARRRAAGGAV